MLMSFPIFACNQVFLYQDIEKSRGLFFDKMLPNKHTTPPIISLAKQSELRNCICNLYRALHTLIRTDLGC